MTSRSRDQSRDHSVIAGPTLNAFLGTEAAACNAESQGLSEVTAGCKVKAEHSGDVLSLLLYGRQSGKHRVTKRGPALSNPMFTLVTRVPRHCWSLESCLCDSSPATTLRFTYDHGQVISLVVIVEIFLLTVMAYDRYLAICNPLRYFSIMSPTICTKLITGSWVGGFVSILVPCLQISSLSFCEGNQIDHYYCDLGSLLKLSCSETSSIEKLFFCLSLLIILGCFLLIIVSYICIIRTIMMFPTASGRRKTFSTFASHLTVVLLFYGPIIFMFVRPSTGGLLHLNKMVSVIPSVVTPLLNPIIYTLRNQEVLEAMKKTAIAINVFH
ncbi:unnamed protein product [Ranitomeya imitator]|uniref:Olfactory receptor n=1 Tax=Ranitomeya imitator TaxID=111125 RepID=A0ABN9MDK6_9NEOB|nr:unnamed protein product [Ranitomeya imitator]